MTATTALQMIVATSSGDVWFELEPVYECDELLVLNEKGLTRPEVFELYPAIVNQGLNGSTETQFKAYIRSLKLKSGALTDANLFSYLAWCLDNARLVDYVIYGVSEYDLILVPSPQQEFGRFNNNRLTPYLEVSFKEGIARTL